MISVRDDMKSTSLVTGVLTFSIAYKYTLADVIPVGKTGKATVLSDVGPNTPIDVQREVIREKLNLAMPDISALQSRLGQFSSASSAGSGSIVVNVAGSVTTERDLVSAITQGIYNNQASGIPISYSTAYR